MNLSYKLSLSAKKQNSNLLINNSLLINNGYKNETEEVQSHYNYCGLFSEDLNLTFLILKSICLSLMVDSISSIRILLSFSI